MSFREYESRDFAFILGHSERFISSPKKGSAWNLC